MIEKTLDSEQSMKQEEVGILGRCWQWFRAGVEAAVAQKTIPDGQETPGSWVLREGVLLPSPDRNRTSLRRLISDFVDAAEIPLMAATLYWRKIADLDVQGSVTLGFGPVECSTRNGKEIFEVKVWPADHVRPRRLRLNPSTAHHFTINVIKVGDALQTITESPIQGVFAAEGILIGGQDVAGPDNPIVIEVSVAPGDNNVLSGIIEGDLC